MRVYRLDAQLTLTSRQSAKPASEMTYTVSGGALNSTQTKPNLAKRLNAETETWIAGSSGVA